MDKTVGIVLENADDIEEDLGTIERRIRGTLVNDSAPKVGELMVSVAKRLCPVGRYNGGRLRDSITADEGLSDDGGIQVTVGTSVEYAPYVEFGTGSHGSAAYKGHTTPGVSFTSKPFWTYFSEELKQFITTTGEDPQPFLRPSLYDTRRQVADLMAGDINKVFQ